MMPIVGISVNPDVHQMEALLAIAAIFSFGLAASVAHYSFRKRARLKEWDVLEKLSQSEDPDVRRKAAERALQILEGK